MNSSSSISTKGIVHELVSNGPEGTDRHHLATRLFGIDFWHTVEFSRSGRAPIIGPFGLFSGQPFKLRSSVFPGQIGLAADRRGLEEPPHTFETLAVASALEARGSPCGTGHLVSVSPCRADIENSTEQPMQSQIGGSRAF